MEWILDGCFPLFCSFIFLILVNSLPAHIYTSHPIVVNDPWYAGAVLNYWYTRFMYSANSKPQQVACIVHQCRLPVLVYNTFLRCFSCAVRVILSASLKSLFDSTLRTCSTTLQSPKMNSPHFPKSFLFWSANPWRAPQRASRIKYNTSTNKKYSYKIRTKLYLICILYSFVRILWSIDKNNLSVSF